MSRNPIFQKNADKYQLLASLKIDATVKSFEKKIKPYLSHPISQKILDANSHVKNYTDLRKSKRAPYTENLEGEIAWILHSILRNPDTINSFLTYKLKFETDFILNNYESAQESHDYIDENLTKSLWGLESNLLLCEYKEGVGKNWELLSDLTKSIKDPFLLFYLEKYSKKAERKISYFSFRTLLENELGGVDPIIREYFLFKLNYPAYFGYKQFVFYLNLESINSIIDRYELLIQIVHELVSAHIQDNTYPFLVEVVDKLLAVIPNDSRLIQFNNILSPANFIKLNFSERLLELFDEYSKGNFQFCLDRSPKLILEFPTSIELYEIYCKSLIERKIEFVPISVSPLIDSILENLFNVYSRNTKNDESTEWLFKISISFFSTSWARQLYSILSYQSTLKSENYSHELLYINHSIINNPRVLNVLPNHKLLDDTISNFRSHYKFLTSEVLIWVNKGDIDLVSSNDEIFENKKFTYIGRILVNQGSEDEIVKHYVSVLQMKDISILLYEEAVTALFDAYVAKKDLKNATVLFVETFLKNRNLVTRLRKDNLINLIENDGYGGLEELIDLPIFFNLTKGDSYGQYVGYDVYMEKLGISKPTELSETGLDLNHEKVVFFLREVCKPEVLNYSIYFDGRDSIEYERIEILKTLLAVDKENEVIYIKELTELTQRITIKKFISEVNKGKITINVQELKKSESNRVKEGFNRYQELALYSKNKDWVSVDLTSNKALNELLNTINEETVTIVNVNDPSYISFKVMFLDLRDKYVLSKEYGLDGYLSTRIRHGTLLNHIRSIFESPNLISQKNKNGEYLDSEYWHERMPHALQEGNSKLQSAIKTFSKTIDNYTESILKELIQIRTEKSSENSKALFDYSYSKDELGYMFAIARESITDYNTFLDFVFQKLEERTTELLSYIRVYINSEIRNRYTSIVDELEKNIRDIIKDNPFPELTFSITKCNTNIQNELLNISEWFTLSDSTADTTMDVESLIQTGVQITNSIYPNNQIHPKIFVKDNFHLKSGINIFDIIRILLNNIISHSGLDSDKLDIKIEAELENSRILVLHFINNLSDSMDLKGLSSKLNAVKSKWRKTEIGNVSIEGGSGFDKIKKIMLIDMGHDDLYFDFKIQDRFITISLGFDLDFV